MVKNFLSKLPTLGYEFEEDWQRNWNAQPLAPVYTGRHSVWNDFRWQPRTRVLTMQIGGDDSSISIRLSKADAQTLTETIKRKLVEQEAVRSKQRHCPTCKCHILAASRRPRRA